MIILRNILMFMILISSCFSASLFALKDAKSNESFKVFLYLDKLTFEDNESVLLHINVKNNTETKKSFKIYDIDYTSFRPVVYDLKGQELETLVTYRLKNITILEAIKDVNPRIIELSQNETFSHSIDLRTIYKIYAGNEYRVKTVFSPDAENSDLIMGDNQLNFKIMKSSDIRNSGIARIRRFISPERVLSPSEVVLLFLKAEKDNNWDNYFKYIDIEKYINAYPDYVRIYNEAIKNSDLEQKERIIFEFVSFLKEKRSDYIIYYKILNELISSENNYYVEALVKRFGAGNPYMYKYRYSLEKYETFWIITDIEATVVKGQKI